MYVTGAAITLASTLVYIICAVAIAWACIGLAFKLPSEPKKPVYGRYDSASAIVKIERNRKAYGYGRNGAIR